MLEQSLWTRTESTADMKYSSGPSQEGGLGGCSPSQFLAEQLTLSQTGGADYAHHSTTSPPDIQTLRRPCINSISA